VGVADFQQVGLKLRARVVFGLNETHPHVVGVMVDDEEVIAKSVRGGDIHWGPDVGRQVHER
jgi:hypothetical protein